MKDRRKCGHYKDEDDTDCPQYKSARQDDDEEEFNQKMGMATIISCGGLVYVVFASCFAVYFENPIVYYIFAIPIIMLGIWRLVKYIKIRKLKKQMEVNNMNMKEDMEQMEIQLPDSTTRTSLMVALRKLNLQYEFDDNQNFIVTYQGEHFRILADNDKIWIQVQDLWWYEASLDDIDNLALLHRAVNECNIRDVNKIVYTYNKEEREIGLHVLREILWLPQIPGSDQYLQTTFDTMLRSHHFFFRMMENLRKEEFAKNN
jgi:hypothetical protein